MTTKNTTVAILSAMSPAFAAQVLSTMNPAEAAATLAAMSDTTPAAAPKRRVAKEAKEEKKAGPNRQHTNDGTERSASQFIRDCGDEMSAKDVVEKAATVGLTIEAPLVYNVRAQAKKRAENALNAEEAAKADEEKKAKLRANLEKARAAKATAKAEAEKAAAEKEKAKAEKAAAKKAAKAEKAKTETPAEAK